MVTSEFTAESARSQFLQLLVTQLKNQDPLEPVTQDDFLQQLAQFSVVEGIESLNTQFSDLLQLQMLTNGAQIVGRAVEFSGDAGLQGGVVQSVRVQQGQLVLDVDGQTVPIDQVRSIANSLDSVGP